MVFFKIPQNRMWWEESNETWHGLISHKRLSLYQIWRDLERVVYLFRLYSTVCRIPGPTAQSVGYQVLQPTKDVKLGQCVWKVADRRKNPWCTKTASNLQPSDLRLNAYRSLSGDQDIFSLLFSCIYIHRNPRVG